MSFRGSEEHVRAFSPNHNDSWHSKATSGHQQHNNEHMPSKASAAKRPRRGPWQSRLLSIAGFAPRHCKINRVSWGVIIAKSGLLGSQQAYSQVAAVCNSVILLNLLSGASDYRINCHSDDVSSAATKPVPVPRHPPTAGAASLKSTWNWSESAFTPVIAPKASIEKTGKLMSTEISSGRISHLLTP